MSVSKQFRIYTFESFEILWKPSSYKLGKVLSIRLLRNEVLRYHINVKQSEIFVCDDFFFGNVQNSR